MNGPRVLTADDFGLIPGYLEILHAGLGQLEGIASDQTIAISRDLYTPNHVRQSIMDETKRYVGHFSEGNLDGILVEGFQTNQFADFVVNRNLIYWVMAKVTGRGIGSTLLRDSIGRAQTEDKDVLSLMVAKENNGARSLYERLGFEYDLVPVGQEILQMHYFVNPEMRPASN